MNASAVSDSDRTMDWDVEAAHAQDVGAVASALAADLDRGLTADEVAVRLERHGRNVLARAQRPRYGAMALRQLTDPLVLLLLVAAAVSFAIGESVEAAAIAAIVVLNGLLGFTQEARAEKEVLALREALERRATVVRSGEEREISADELVPGDLVVLVEGERVPADGRVVLEAGLAADESSLTGESVPVDKSAAPVAADAPLGDRSSMAFAGTGVTRGRGRMVVTATGDRTEIGRIAGLTERAVSPPTPLQRRIKGLARIMVGLGIAVTVLLTSAMLVRGEPFEEAFLVGVSVAVAAVPEGLAATVTIALALGAREMARRGAIVRRLTAVETLGSATVVASDKTGTLTENRLRLVDVAPAPGRTDDDLLAGAALASRARLVDGGDGSTDAAGDPVDAAIVLAAEERGATRALGDPVREIPFEAERKLMTLVFEHDGSHRAYAKGAPEVVFDRSATGTDVRRALEEQAERWAAEGLRVLAVAERSVADISAADEELEHELQPLGLVALQDPLRPSAGPAVTEAQAAGIRVEMVTGDHPITARAIGDELGLAAESVHARIAPADKLRLVTELQEAGEVVAVTGDGVNDAPALRRADVGVAMGLAGTEAAREAADLVLTDDDFATIIAAVREGRAIADNIRKFVAFLLSANLGEVALFAVAIPAGLGVPMTVVQVLLVNVLTDGLPAVALTRDPPSPGIMRRPPQRGDRLFPPRAWAALAAIGMLVGLAALVAFLVGREESDATATTMAFTTVALAELALVYSLRSPTLAAWQAPRNRYLAGSVVVSACVVLVVVYLPALHQAAGTVSLSSTELALAALLALAPFLCVEVGKAASRRLGWALDPDVT